MSATLQSIVITNNYLNVRKSIKFLKSICAFMSTRVRVDFDVI